MQVKIIASYETNNDRRMKQGGYCMTMLYGVLPPAMAWAMHNRDKDIDKGAISRAKPALLCVCLIASCIVLEQIIADLSLLHL